MMSNYFHDVATAMPMACGVAMWLILKRYEAMPGPSALSSLIRLYRGISKIMIFSVVWIVGGGTIRILTLRSFEWANAAAKNQLKGLVLKYIIGTALMAGGAYLWIRLKRRIGEIQGAGSRGAG